jgi:hypothetical protein
MKNKHFVKDFIYAGMLAGIFSGIPSICYFLFLGIDWTHSTKALGLIFFDASQPGFFIYASAGIIHFTVSCFWSFILRMFLPRKNTIIWAGFAGILIAFFDLIIIARFIPTLANLDFYPQLADHILWGIIVGFIYNRMDLTQAK